MYTTMDSQPQEWLTNQSDALHTIAFCSFRDGKHARAWIHRLVPRNRNGALVKWSTGGPAARVERRRKQFIDLFSECFDEIDFIIHCVSSTEGQISNFANALYLQNLSIISQRVDTKGRNCLVFRLTETEERVVPVLRAAKLIWIFFCVRYMKEVHNLSGFLYSDWFSCDTPGAHPNTMGVSLVNLLLSSTEVGLQLSIAVDPRRSEADLLSDWVSGWCNSTKSGIGPSEFARQFEVLSERNPAKFEAVHFDCAVKAVNA
jgi:hypothetical protein